MCLEYSLLRVYIIEIRSIQPETVQDVAKRRANFGRRWWKRVRHGVHRAGSSATGPEGCVGSKPNVSGANLHRRRGAYSHTGAQVDCACLPTKLRSSSE